MTTVRFGTDGIRGIAGETLTVELAAALGVALMQQHPAGLVLIGRDTRPSGPALTDALAGAIEAHGGTVIDVGVIPTPGLASLVAGEPHAACGVVVTASHNPVEYNGLKVLARDGRKIPDAEERALEAAMERALAGGLLIVAPSASHAAEAQAYRERYERTLAELARSVSASALSVVVDAAHGAASPFAVAALAATGATVLPFAMGDGIINDGVGATDPVALGEQVRAHGADLGIALDGDADRCVVVDADGRAIDGDVLIALIALDRKGRGVAGSERAVATVLTNSGVERHLAAHGITLERTPVGDRHIADRLAAGQGGFGGEKSGHLLFTELSPTGDGLLSAITVLGLVARAGIPVGEMADAVPLDPQLQRTVPVPPGEGERLLAEPDLQNAIRQAEAALAQTGGRLLVRLSGTEPLLRVMGEGPDRAAVTAAVEHLLEVAASLVRGR
ncbi:MAG: phosphoglucosamine mutase [Chloroflexi bacterium]|nr:phosphoglucosamine mutase [Chloroflexota bacterium]